MAARKHNWRTHATGSLASYTTTADVFVGPACRSSYLPQPFEKVLVPSLSDTALCSECFSNTPEATCVDDAEFLRRCQNVERASLGVGMFRACALKRTYSTLPCETRIGYEYVLPAGRRLVVY